MSLCPEKNYFQELVPLRMIIIITICGEFSERQLWKQLKYKLNESSHMHLWGWWDSSRFMGGKVEASSSGARVYHSWSNSKPVLSCSIAITFILLLLEVAIADGVSLECVYLSTVEVKVWVVPCWSLDFLAMIAMSGPCSSCRFLCVLFLFVTGSQNVSFSVFNKGK